MLTALLFDLDGTLTDTDTLHLQAFRQLLREHDGRELSQAQFEAQVSGRANGELFAELFSLQPGPMSGPGRAQGGVIPRTVASADAHARTGTPDDLRPAA